MRIIENRRDAACRVSGQIIIPHRGKYVFSLPDVAGHVPTRFCGIDSDTYDSAKKNVPSSISQQRDAFPPS